MKDFTCLAAVTFTGRGQTHIRAFYQHDSLIKESCYGSQDGWYTTRGDIVAECVKEDTAIAATSNGIQIAKAYSARYLLNLLFNSGLRGTTDTRQRVRTTVVAGDEDQWSDVTDFPAKVPAGNTKLTAALSDEDEGANINLFYQDPDNSIKEIKFDGSTKTWDEDSDTVLTEAKPGTGLSVVAGPNGQLRLFYQNTQGAIKEYYSDNNREWGPGMIASYHIAPRAPIAALAWNYRGNLEIRVFSIGPESRNISEMIFEKKCWRQNPKVGSGEIIVESERHSALAAVRVPDESQIYIFYQPRLKVIGLYSPIANEKIPLGIPTTALQRRVDGPAVSSLGNIPFCTVKQTEEYYQAAMSAPQDPGFPIHATMHAAIPNWNERKKLSLPNASLWRNGQVLRVLFIGGNDYLRGKVRQYAKTWEQYANIQFQFIDFGYAEIRIAFQAGEGSWSYIGTDNLKVPESKPTMNFGWFNYRTADEEFSRTILHEFGHALGCIHEHQNPAGNIHWNRDKVYAYYLETSGWPKSKVDSNIFRRYDRNSTQYTAFDTQSIMIYPIPPQLTLDGFSVGWGRTLSQTDKEFMRRIYPN